MAESDKVFAGSIPRIYDEYLVPLIFEPYAQDLARRLNSRRLARVLEIAAGTFAEARRVLRPGGLFVFNVWDRIEENEFAAAVTDRLAELFPTDAPRFMARTPHGYHDAAVIERDLAAGGFRNRARIATVAARSRAATARAPAIAYCQGTPLRNEIEARDASRLGEATDACEAAIAARFGAGPVDGKIQAMVIEIEA